MINISGYVRGLSTTKAAAILFWINLIPAGICLLLALDALDQNGPLDLGTGEIATLVFTAISLSVEAVYFCQFNFSKHANNKGLWVYSMIVSSVFIAFVVYIAATVKVMSALIFLVYPNCFFYLSYEMFKKLNVTSIEQGILPVIPKEN
ncbi:hypothetical protein GCM10023149_45470 [Mucilaginibacter gynuensis]|uniref:Uncharacterized protein n=1 Tax=Mucilaginibacter gynuensis TaxID=1302236 RepID=A0ABP8HAT1_9SPHI